MDSQKALRLVQGLLAKAESTHSQHEADALVAKAKELMLAHSIDEMAARARGERPAERPQVAEWEYSASDSNAVGKATLLNIVCRHTGVRLVNMHNRRYSNMGRRREDGTPVGVASQWCWLTGYENDVARAKMLYTSLLLQAQSFARQDFGKRPPSKVFTSYLMGYAVRIDERLKEREPAPAESTALVVRRDEEVDAAHRERFPHLTQRKTSAGRDFFGRTLGAAAANRADVGDRRLPQQRKALS